MFNFLSQAFIPSTSNSSGSFATLNPFQMTGNQLGFLNGQTQAYNYQQELNQKMMSREDNAYQRAVADAKAAGLSPLSVSGGASANSMQSASFNNSGVLSFGAQLAQLKVEADIQKEKNAIAKQDADTRAKIAESSIPHTEASTELIKTQERLARQIAPLDREKTLAQINQIRTATVYQAQENIRRNDYRDTYIKLSGKEYEKLDADAKYVVASTACMLSRTDSQNLLNAAETTLAKHQIKLVDAEKASEEQKVAFADDYLKMSYDMNEQRIRSMKKSDKVAIYNAFINGIKVIGGLAIGAYGVTHGNPWALFAAYNLGVSGINGFTGNPGTDLTTNGISYDVFNNRGSDPYGYLE